MLKTTPLEYYLKLNPESNVLDSSQIDFLSKCFEKDLKKRPSSIHLLGHEMFRPVLPEGTNFAELSEYTKRLAD